MKITNEAKIGIMVTVVLGILFVLTIRAGKFDFSNKGYMMKIHFRNIDGVNLNAPVMLNGLEVGSVKNIKIYEMDDDIKMELHVFIKEHAKLREGAQAYVKNMGFLGEKYVGLTSGTKGGDFLKPNSIIQGKDPADLDALLLDGQAIAADLKEITANIKERLEINEKRIDDIFANTQSLTANIDERLKVNEGKIDSTLSNLNSASTNLDQFTYDLKLHPWKLLYRSKEKRQRSIELLEKEKLQEGE